MLLGHFWAFLSLPEASSLTLLLALENPRPLRLRGVLANTEQELAQPVRPEVTDTVQAQVAVWSNQGVCCDSFRPLFCFR